MPKTNVIIDRIRLESAIVTAENEGPVKNLSTLWDITSEIYNKDLPDDDQITTQMVAGRVKEWDIKIKTQAKKGRAAVEIDEDKLKEAVVLAEKDGPLANLTTLWSRVAEIYQDLTDVPITTSVVYLRVNSLGLTLKTQKGKKGLNGGFAKGRPPGGTSRRSKFAKSPVAQLSVAAMKEMLINNNAERYMPLVDRIAKGSMKAAVRFNCLQCVAFVPREVALCGCRECAFFAFRPKVNESPEGVAEIDLEIPDEIL
jgi:hypothetical protein